VRSSLVSGGERSQADFGIGATGVAGPGDQDGRPVGEVFTAIASGPEVVAKRYHFDDTWNEIRMTTVVAALFDLVDVLEAVIRKN
jgi:nicotinamide-nucleotide amidase